MLNGRALNVECNCAVLRNLEFELHVRTNKRTMKATNESQLRKRFPYQLRLCEYLQYHFDVSPLLPYKSIIFLQYLVVFSTL